jgi:hypothetical protein
MASRLFLACLAAFLGPACGSAPGGGGPGVPTGRQAEDAGSAAPSAGDADDAPAIEAIAGPTWVESTAADAVATWTDLSARAVIEVDRQLGIHGADQPTAVRALALLEDGTAVRFEQDGSGAKLWRAEAWRTAEAAQSGLIPVVEEAASSPTCGMESGVSWAARCTDFPSMRMHVRVRSGGTDREAWCEWASGATCRWTYESSGPRTCIEPLGRGEVQERLDRLARAAATLAAGDADRDWLTSFVAPHAASGLPRGPTRTRAGTSCPPRPPWC